MDAKEAEQLCVEAVQIITRESTDEENRRAADLFRSVAEAGYSQGMFGLAELYMAGKGIIFSIYVDFCVLYSYRCF